MVVVEKFSIIRMNRYQLQPFDDISGANHRTVNQYQQQQAKQKNNNNTSTQTTTTTTTSQINKLIGLSELAERIKVLGKNTTINSDFSKLLVNKNQQHKLLMKDNQKKNKVLDSEYQILDNVSLTEGKQNVRDDDSAVIDHDDKVHGLSITELHSVDAANENGLQRTIIPEHIHKGHYKTTEKYTVKEDHKTNNKTERMRQLSVSSVLLNSKRNNTVRRKRNNTLKGVDQGNNYNTTQNRQHHHHKKNKTNSNSNIDLGYMTFSSKETLSEIDEEMESDFDDDDDGNEIESDALVDGEHLFSVRRINSRNNINNRQKNMCQMTSNTLTIDYQRYGKVSLEKSTEQLIHFSTSPFVLNKGKGRSKDLRSTLKSDMTISGRNPVDIANENHAKKDRAMSADCTLRSFHFTIEKRKVVSISKESAVITSVPSSIKRDGQAMCNNENNNNERDNIDSISCMKAIKTLSIKKPVNDQNNKEIEKIGNSIMSSTTKKIATVDFNKNNRTVKDPQLALDVQAYMYLGLATARSCRNKRRRHSFDHIRSHRQLQRNLLQQQSCQGRFLGALVACSSSRENDHFSDGDGDKKEPTINHLHRTTGKSLIRLLISSFVNT